MMNICFGVFGSKAGTIGWFLNFWNARKSTVYINPAIFYNSSCEGNFILLISHYTKKSTQKTSEFHSLNPKIDIN